MTDETPPEQAPEDSRRFQANPFPVILSDKPADRRARAKNLSTR